MGIDSLKTPAPVDARGGAQQPGYATEATGPKSNGPSTRLGITGFPEGRTPQVPTSGPSRNKPLRLGKPPSTVTRDMVLPLGVRKPDHLADYELAPFKHPETGDIVQLVGRYKANGMFQPFKDGQPEGRPLTRVNITGRGENLSLPSTIVADVRMKGGRPPKDSGRSGHASSSSSTSYTATVGNARFESNSNGRQMQQVAEFIGGLPIAHVLSSMAPIRVHFGRTPGGGVGEWNQRGRTVTLDDRHPRVLEQGVSRLAGAGAFEIINASSQPRRSALDEEARRGEFEIRAVGTYFTPAQLYAREVERLEFQNIQQHHDMMINAGHGDTTADLFAGESSNFEDYYAYQVQSGHTRDYEEHYRHLRAPPILMSREQQQANMDAFVRSGNQDCSKYGSAQDYYNPYNQP